MLPDPAAPPSRVAPPALAAAAPAGVVVEGEARHLGAPGRFRLLADVAGRHRFEVTGPLGEAHGWDGEAGWAVDWDQVDRPIALRELDLARLLALGATGLWRSACGVAHRTPRRVLLAFPGRPVIGVAEVGADGWLAAMEGIGPAGPIHYRFSEHREIDGLEVDGVVEVTQDELLLDRLVVERATALDAPVVWTAPAAPPRDVHWAAPGCTLPLRRAASGHLLVEAALDGHTGWFVLDTGAQLHVIAPAWARRLDLPRRGVAPLSSVLGTEAAPVCQAGQLAVGALTVAAPHLVELALAPLAGGLGVELAGVLGFGLFRRAVVDLDADAEQLHLVSLDAAPPAVAWHPLVLDHCHPIVSATLPSLGERLLRLDLGAAGEPFGHLVLTRPTASELLDGAAHRSVPPTDRCRPPIGAAHRSVPPTASAATGSARGRCRGSRSAGSASPTSPRRSPSTTPASSRTPTWRGRSAQGWWHDTGSCSTSPARGSRSLLSGGHRLARLAAGGEQLGEAQRRLAREAVLAAAAHVQMATLAAVLAGFGIRRHGTAPGKSRDF